MSALIEELNRTTGLSIDRIVELVLFSDREYNQYFIKQKDKYRQIEEPSPHLRALQIALLPHFTKYPLHEAAIFGAGTSISTNANVHLGQKHILKVDIKNCYQSITLEKVTSALCDEPTFEYLVQVLPACFIRLRNGTWCLPTGAPTSPMLCNIALTLLDYKIATLCIAHGYKYTRYFDDITVSTNGDIRRWNMLSDIQYLLGQDGYQINKKKSKWAKRFTDKMVVTGVNVLRKERSIPREMKRKVRLLISDLALGNQDLTDEAKGYLAHISDIDPNYYQYLLECYERKKVSNATNSK